MYVVVNDWHFNDETIGKKNIPSIFQSDFLNELRKVIKKVKPKKVKFVFNGDIFDLIVSARWNYELGDGRYLYNKQAVQPWNKDEIEVLKKAQEIFHAILETQDVKVFLKNFRAFCQEISPPVEVHYIARNHDRLLGFFPELRGEVASALGLTEGKNLFFEDFVFDEKISLYVSHGDEYDIFYQLEGERIFPAIGDAFTIGFFNRLPIEVLIKTGNQECFQKLAEVENVKSRQAKLAFIQTALKESGIKPKVFESIVLDILSDCFSGQFVKEWSKRHYRAAPFLLKLLRHRKALRMDGILARIFNTFLFGKQRNKAEGNLSQKKRLAGLGQEKEIKYFVFGHTHDFEETALDNGQAYLNLGTWLRQYHRVDSGFQAARSLNYALFFEEGEKSSSDFEIKQISLRV